MRCSNCGASMDKDDRFCAVCGAPNVGQEKKQSGKGKIIIAVIIVLIVIALAAFALVRLLNGNDKNEEPENSPYQEVADIDGVAEYDVEISGNYNEIGRAHV